MENWHEYIFFENSKSIGLSVYLDSQSNIESHYSKYGQWTSSTHLTQVTGEMQARGPHPRPIKRNPYVTKIFRDLYAPKIGEVLR